MPIKVVDLKEMARQEHPKRTVLINGPRLHAWFHPYLAPGQKDEMHCHNQDQTFYCIEGECTMSFPDGTKSVLRPGMVAQIELAPDKVTALALHARDAPAFHGRHRVG